MVEDIKALAVKLVAAYLGENTVAVGDVPALIQSTYTALLNAAVPEPLPIEKPHPAVPVRKSVTPEAIICLDCGKRQKMLKRHIHTAHRLSVEDYRSKWSLPADYPMVAAAYAAKRSQSAVAHGLGRKKSAEATASIEGSRPGYNYPASRWSKPSE